MSATMSATMRPTAFRRANRLTVSRWLTFAALCAVWIGLAAKPVFAANPPPVQVFYVPIPEDQAFTSLATMFPGNAACGLVGFAEVAEPITTYNSISILAEGTVIYYDHWEDGFEIDISHPTQPSSQIWGDGVTGNGRPPNINSDLLAPNTVIVLRSDVTLADRQFDIDFDGGDRIAASRTVAFTRAFWARGPNTLQAGAIEVYPTDEWGTRFRAPAGVNTPSPSLFEYTALVIMAANNGTLVEVDLDANGTIDAQTTLNQGQSYLTAGTVRQGALVQASAPVQVAMVTGDICDTYEARWYVLFPENQWTNRYYSPVSTSPEFGTTAFLYNPHATVLTVTRETQGGGLLNVNIAAQSGISVPVPSNSGAAFVAADGRPFLAIAAVDTTNPENSRGDWGFALIPERQLTAQTLIGWGAGRNPDSLVNPNENSSPVWVIPVYPDGETGPVNICVDFKADNQGGLVDANGFRYDELLSLAEFESAQVFDHVARNQTGMLLYVCPTAANQPVTARLAAAWGEDPAIATPGQPALDLGTTAPPAAMFEAGKAATLIADVDGDGKADGGDSLRYDVLIRNASRVPIPGLSISDTVPLHTTYLTGTTTVDLGSGPAPVPDAGSTAFPLDEGGIALGTLPSNGQFTVTFDVRIVNPLPAGVDRVRNVAVVRAGDEQREPEVETPVDFDPTPAIALTKEVNDNAVRAGTTVTYTFVVSNTGDDPLRQVALADNRCAVAFVEGDTGSDDVLGVAEAWTYTCSAVITRTVTNVAVVTAVDSLSRTITATATARVVVPVLYLPLLWAPERTVPCPPPNGCPVGAQVKALAVHTTARLVYLTTRVPDQIVLMDANTTDVLAGVAIGGEPWGVAVNEQTNRVYVSRYTGGDVRVFNALTLAPIETIPVGDNPSLIAVLPALDTAFVLVQGGSKVAIIEGADPVPTIVDAGGSKPFGIAADPVFNRIFISHRDSHSLSVLRQEGGVWKAFPGPQFTDNRQVFEIAYDTATQRLFVVYARTIEGVDRWFLDVWEPRDVGDWGYFATRDIPSGGAIASSLVGGTGIEINPSTGNLFITNTGADSLTVMDATTLGLLATVTLGDDPFAVAINRLFNEVYVGLRTPGRLIKLVDAY